MFRQRSYKKELLDADDIPVKQLYQNLRELEQVNKRLGGINISMKGVKCVMQSSKHVSIADIGCGGGDLLKSAASYAREKAKDISLTGIDIKQDCIAYARSYCEDYPEIELVCGDYKHVLGKDQGVTHVHAALFCHHLNDEEIVELIRFCKEKKLGLIINDLERHPLAYYSIYIITRLLNGSALVKHDAPLSVLRGFKKIDWYSLFEQAGVQRDRYSVKWQWAFRHLIIMDRH